MASWGDVQVYSEMIDDLGAFCKSIEEAVDVMDVAATTCKDNMENDESSQKAAANVKKSEKLYLEAAKMAAQLAKELQEEQQALIEYLRQLDSMGDSGSGE